MSPSSPTGAGIEEREAGPAGSSRDAGMDLGGRGGSRKGVVGKVAGAKEI